VGAETAPTGKIAPSSPLATFVFVQLVVTVAGFGERVGTERGSLLGRHQFVDEVFWGGFIVKVINDLGALVSKKAEVFKTTRAT
jgi:hypothetical protein